MAAKPLPSQEVLRQLLDYDPETGKLTWKARTPDMFSADGRDPEWKARNWNSKLAGQEAFNVLAPNGYLAGKLGPRRMYAHRLVWMWFHGRCPDYIDHINGDRTDNRLANLRETTKVKNQRNVRYTKPSKSGVVGVKWFKPASKWSVSIGCNGLSVWLGYYEDKLDAVAVRKEAERLLGFSERHGFEDGIEYSRRVSDRPVDKRFISDAIRRSGYRL